MGEAERENNHRSGEAEQERKGEAEERRIGYGCINKTSQTGVVTLSKMCKGDHQEVSNQTAQTYTKRYVHPKSRRHYSTALKIKKGEGGKRKGGRTSQITFVVLM